MCVLCYGDRVAYVDFMSNSERKMSTSPDAFRLVPSSCMPHFRCSTAAVWHAQLDTSQARHV